MIKFTTIVPPPAKASAEKPAPAVPAATPARKVEQPAAPDAAPPPAKRTKRKPAEPAPGGLL